MDALQNATNEVMQEASSADPMFKEVYESMQNFRAGYDQWKKLGSL
jgi:TRAP-type mannitol/chloroaromatic compound transport system substrate-binding protein